MYWSPSGSHSAATQLLSNLFSAPQLLSYYSPRCHLVEKSPSFTRVTLQTWVCSSERPAQELRGIGEKGQTLTHLVSKQIPLSSHFSIASPKMACLHTDKVFWTLRKFLLCCPANEIRPLLLPYYFYQEKFYACCYYVLFSLFSSLGNSYPTRPRFSSLSDLKGPW